MRVLAERSEPVMPLTRETATPEEPFAIRDAGPGTDRLLDQEHLKYYFEDGDALCG
jgi:hypothetical protein